MKIIDNALRGIEFGELGVGATFKYEDDYFIKMRQIPEQMELCNAVNLEEGIMRYFEDNELVLPFNCELIVL